MRSDIIFGMKNTVVLGSTNTDMVIMGKKIPVLGETISGGKFLMSAKWATRPGDQSSVPFRKEAK